MFRFLFVILGVPIMIMSLMHPAEAVPFAEKVELLSNGQAVELDESQQISLLGQVQDLFAAGRKMPAFSVMLDSEYDAFLSDGIFVRLTFPQILQIDGMPFDELIFKVEENFYGFNIIRGLDGRHEGRCFFLDLGQNTTASFYDFASSLLAEN